MIKVQFGSGHKNLLPGWVNHDIEVDITKYLPYHDGAVDYILCEHCVEHVTQHQAIDFFKECHRILRQGGVARIIVPSIEQIIRKATPKYCEFTTKWQNIGPTVRGACHSIVYAHGHQACWNESMLRDLMWFAGFDNVTKCDPSISHHRDLLGVDGHSKSISDAYNRIESCIMEGTK